MHSLTHSRLIAGRRCAEPTGAAHRVVFDPRHHSVAMLVVSGLRGRLLHRDAAVLGRTRRRRRALPRSTLQSALLLLAAHDPRSAEHRVALPSRLCTDEARPRRRDAHVARLLDHATGVHPPELRRNGDAHPAVDERLDDGAPWDQDLPHDRRRRLGHVLPRDARRDAVLPRQRLCAPLQLRRRQRHARADRDVPVRDVVGHVLVLLHSRGASLLVAHLHL